MRTILDNAGNRRHFEFCQKRVSKRYGLTVNAWFSGGRSEPSYDAAFYVGPDTYRKPAAFESRQYRNRVAYRVRVYPKGKPVE